MRVPPVWKKEEFYTVYLKKEGRKESRIVDGLVKNTYLYCIYSFSTQNCVLLKNLDSPPFSTHWKCLQCGIYLFKSSETVQLRLNSDYLIKCRHCDVSIIF